jgi:hypothetical protein
LATSIGLPPPNPITDFTPVERPASTAADNGRTSRGFERFQARVGQAKSDELFVRHEQDRPFRQQSGNAVRFSFACDQARSGMKGEGAHSSAD